jgi:hypothetical protein
MKQSHSVTRWTASGQPLMAVSVSGQISMNANIWGTWQAVVASLFACEERFKVVFGDQAAASCLYRSQLAGAQQVMDELPGDAQ